MFQSIVNSYDIFKDKTYNYIIKRDKLNGIDVEYIEKDKDIIITKIYSTNPYDFLNESFSDYTHLS